MQQTSGLWSTHRHWQKVHWQLINSSAANDSYKYQQTTHQNMPLTSSTDLQHCNKLFYWKCQQTTGNWSITCRWQHRLVNNKAANHCIRNTGKPQASDQSYAIPTINWFNSTQITESKMPANHSTSNVPWTPATDHEQCRKLFSRNASELLATDQ